MAQRQLARERRRRRHRIGMEIDDYPDREQDGIAERPLPHHRQPHQERLERLRRRQPLQGLQRRLGHHRVGHQLYQRPDRAGIADGAERIDGRELQPQLALEQLQQRGHRVRGAELAQGLDGGLGHVEVGVPHQRQDPGRGRRVPDPAQHLQREHHHVDLRVGQHGLQVGQRVGALPLQRGNGGVAPHRIGLVGHQLPQHRRLDVPRREPNGALPHRGRLVLQRREDRGLEVGALGERVEGRHSRGHRLPG
jgi:hypothetical protein